MESYDIIANQPVVIDNVRPDEQLRGKKKKSRARRGCSNGG